MHSFSGAFQIITFFAVFVLLGRSVAGDVPLFNSSDTPETSASSGNSKLKVLILGGGVAGVIAARTFHAKGITDFLIIEARSELGGRMMSGKFGSASKGNGTMYTIEQGANWIQGTQAEEGKGPSNPIYDLAKKHGVKTQYNDWFGSIATYDSSGAVDYLNTFNKSEDDYADLTVLGGTRVAQSLVDLSARTGYSLVGAKYTDPHAAACEYYEFDWEYAQTPAETSLIASSWGNNYTYNTDQGGFSDDNRMSIDQRGFKTLIQAEGAEFLVPQQVRLNATVETVSYSDKGVTVTLTDGERISADYALATFSLGVLQHDDVVFSPPLPAYKQEAIQSMVMATYTKIFMQFPEKFWFDEEMGLYADAERGRYPVWQSLDHPDFFPGSGILFVTVTGDYSIRIEDLPDSQVKMEVMSVVRSMFPNVTVPDPVDFFFPRWHTNPLFRGSYSNWPPSFSSQHLDNLRANVGKLYFAGEATSRKYFGFLHGAYFEGLEIATLMASCVSGKTCRDLRHFARITNAIPYV